MKNVSNIDNIPEEYMDDPAFLSKLKTVLIGDAIGCEKLPVKTNDVISKPAGKNITHQFINNSSGILQILDIGTREEDDIVTYPDEDIVYIKNKKLVFNRQDRIKNWTSEPNG